MNNELFTKVALFEKLAQAGVNPVVKNLLIKSIDCFKKLGISESGYLPITKAVNFGILNIAEIKQCLMAGSAISIPAKGNVPAVNFEKYFNSVIDFLTKMSS